MKNSRTICAFFLAAVMLFCVACNSNKPTDDSSCGSSFLDSDEMLSSDTQSDANDDGNPTVSEDGTTATNGNQSSTNKPGTSTNKPGNSSTKNEGTKNPTNNVNSVTKNEVTETTPTEKDKAEDMVDFVINVPATREPKILHLTDTQIIDSSQKRTSNRLDPTQNNYWAPDKKDERCYNYLREIINAVKPDLILLTGDLVYGEFDDSGNSLLELIEFMDGFNIPWAPVFGNHETESKKGVDWQCEQLEKSKNCLFLQRKMSGNGNYTVGIKQGNKLTRVFFMLDSNGGANPSPKSNANGHTKTTIGFGTDQINWYTNLVNSIKKESPATKISMAFHIQLAVFADAFSAKYGTDGSSSHVHIDQLDNKPADDFGYIGAALKSPWDKDKAVWNGFKKLGVDSIFVGHEHANSASIVYEGIRLQFGMKCSTYDRLNYISPIGKIESTYYSTNTPWVGGSHFKLAADGTIKDAEIYYCKDAGGDIDWEDFKPKPDEPVNGLKKDIDLTYESGLSVSGVKFDQNINAYKVHAGSQGKLFVNKELLKNKNTLTFTVYVPASSSNKLAGYGEFAIRTKPNDIEPSTDGKADGYINYKSTSTNNAYKIKFDTWQTFTVDISALGTSCTEFAFIIAAGNVIYLRDIQIR